jgi:tetratricopeptide (TPR) repeat protein
MMASHGITVHSITVAPWRFDDARNAALALVDADIDYCIALDLDEQLQPGWREHLEAAAAKGFTRPRYRYVWNWTPEGAPGLVYGGDKIHTRAGYRWRHPVHETLVPTSGQEAIGWCDLEIHHYADDTKPRSQYLPLLELAVAEDPTDDRNAHYLAREYLFAGRWDKAEDEFRRHLALPKARWAPERAASMRYLANVVWLRRWNLPGGLEETETWLLRACAEAPGYREPWLDLAQHYQRIGDQESAMLAARRGLQITERTLDYLTLAEAWDGVTLESLAHPLLTVSVPTEGEPG